MSKTIDGGEFTSYHHLHVDYEDASAARVVRAYPDRPALVFPLETDCPEREEGHEAEGVPEYERARLDLAADATYSYLTVTTSTRETFSLRSCKHCRLVFWEQV